MNLREKIASAAARPPRKVTISAPGFEGEYYIRGLTIAERDRYEGSCIKERSVKGKLVTSVNTENMRARLLALCLVNADGVREFQETDTDVALLAKLPADVGEPLFKAAQEESGLSERDLEELKGN